MTAIKTIEEIEIINDNILGSICNEIKQREGDKFNERVKEYLRGGRKPMIFEATEYGIYEKYKEIKKKKERGEIQKAEEGRYRVLKYMINCIIAEPMEGNNYSKENDEMVKEGGRMLDEEGVKYDENVWRYIPKRFQREIDMKWEMIDIKKMREGKKERNERM